MPNEELPGARWLREHWEELRQVNFQWVAADGDHLVARSPDLEAVMAQVLQQGLTEQAVFALVDFDEEIR